jgi:hypothetical protein
MPAAGTHFAVARFNLPAIDPPRPHGIFVVSLVDAAKIVASTSLDKALSIRRRGRSEFSDFSDV